MPLVLALKNAESIIVASDTPGPSDGTIKYGQFMNLPGRAVLLLAGNIEAVRRPIMERVLPKLTADTGAAVLAQLIHAALVLEVVPHLPQITGRVEIIVAGIDPIRHIETPSLYCLDSAQDFYLKVAPGDVAAAGSAAVVNEVVGGRDLSSTSTDELIAIAKECLATTKMRWPAALGQHIRIGTVTFTNISIQDY
jgi:hypothetical protein